MAAVNDEIEKLKEVKTVAIDKAEVELQPMSKGKPTEEEKVNDL